MTDNTSRVVLKTKRHDHGIGAVDPETRYVPGPYGYSRSYQVVTTSSQNPPTFSDPLTPLSSGLPEDLFPDDPVLQWLDDSTYCDQCYKFIPNTSFYIHSCTPPKVCNRCDKVEYVCQLNQCTLNQLKTSASKPTTKVAPVRVVHKPQKPSLGTFRWSDVNSDASESDLDDLDDPEPTHCRESSSPLASPPAEVAAPAELVPKVELPFTTVAYRRRAKARHLVAVSVQNNTSKIIPGFERQHLPVASVCERDVQETFPVSEVPAHQSPGEKDRRSIRLSTGFISAIGAIPKSHSHDDFFLQDAISLASKLGMPTGVRGLAAN